MAIEGVAASVLAPETVQRFLVARRTAGYTYMRSTKALGPLLGYLRQLSVVSAPTAAEPSRAPAEVLLNRYLKYLLGERGVTAKTATDYVNLVRPFLAGRVQNGATAMAPLTSADASGFVVAECRRRKPRAATRYPFPRRPVRLVGSRAWQNGGLIYLLP
jgi:hypothetical protein